MTSRGLAGRHLAPPEAGLAPAVASHRPATGALSAMGAFCAANALPVAAWIFAGGAIAGVGCFAVDRRHRVSAGPGWLAVRRISTRWVRTDSIALITSVARVLAMQDADGRRRGVPAAYLRAEPNLLERVGIDVQRSVAAGLQAPPKVLKLLGLGYVPSPADVSPPGS
jgi:hypothetical protein